MFVEITQQCFALLHQVNFPANNLNLYWSWRWWDQIQAIFLNLFYFTFYLFFRIWSSQFWKFRSGIRIWSLRNRIWLPKCLIFLFTIMKFKNSQTIRQKQSNNSSKCSMIIANVCLHTKNNNSPGKSAISSKTYLLLSIFCFIYLF